MKKVYVKTFGCQMNEHDSEIMLSRLKRIGYLATPNPKEADLILVNTCSIRDKAHHKALSEIGRFKKNRNGDRVKLGVTGCVAGQEGKKLREQFPYIDLVLGPDHIKDIDRHVSLLSEDSYVIASHFLDREAEQFPQVGDFISQSSVKAYVTIMKGCDHVCSYCIVPSVRGKEVSRDPDEIVKEVKNLATQGVKEVMLLGQNVNSYGRALMDSSASKTDFATLLQRLDEEADIERIRFMSPHPTNLSKELVEQYRTNRSLCPYIHLPVQSGSTAVLKKMRRSYTREVYLKKVEELRAACPDVALTTDVIVGFPEETETQFQESLSLIEEVQFDNIYAFTYSPRPGTEAAAFADDVSPEDKERRHQTLIDRQRDYSLRNYQKRVGVVEDVLVEKLSKKGDGQLTGRTPHNRILNFYSDPDCIGAIIKVRVTEAQPYSLKGEVV
jgi:tRNA-2-methylthio-N6-dimethylallyladenosine synthase